MIHYNISSIAVLESGYIRPTQPATPDTDAAPGVTPAMATGSEAALRASPLAVAADRVGATASFLCAVHCALLPFVIALLPLIGLGFLAGHAFERVFVVCAAALAMVSIAGAYRRHRKPHALFLMIPGIVLLVTGVAIEIDRHIVLHTACVVTGGVLVASAHLANLVIARRHLHRADCHHPGA
jgi:uncharacterized membrane protein YjjB (DUF3815 family)